MKSTRVTEIVGLVEIEAVDFDAPILLGSAGAAGEDPWLADSLVRLAGRLGQRTALDLVPATDPAAPEANRRASLTPDPFGRCIDADLRQLTLELEDVTSRVRRALERGRSRD